MTKSKHRTPKDHEFLPSETIAGKCIICWRIYNAKTQRELQSYIREELNKVRLDSGCATCGYNDNAAALQFDHIIPIAYIGNKRKDRLPRSKAELRRFLEDDNIQVLCANCHCIKTRENKDYKARSIK